MPQKHIWRRNEKAACGMCVLPQAAGCRTRSKPVSIVEQLADRLINQHNYNEIDSRFNRIERQNRRENHAGNRRLGQSVIGGGNEEICRDHRGNHANSANG